MLIKRVEGATACSVAYYKALVAQLVRVPYCPLGGRWFESNLGQPK